MGKGNRRLVVRLPSDHWIWTVQDPGARSARVKEALDFYWRFAESLNEIKQALADLKAARSAELQGAPGSGPPSDDRLLSSIDKFLDM